MPHFDEAENSDPNPACSPSSEPPSPTLLQEIDNQSRISERNLVSACRSGDLAPLQSVFDDIASRSGLDRERHEEHITRQLDFCVALAARNGHANVVECLLEHGAPPIAAADQVTQHKDTDAIIRVFEVLLKHGLDLKDCPWVLWYVRLQAYVDWTGGELIKSSRVNQNETLLRYLLSKGADPNAKDSFGRLPLESCGSVAIVASLLDYGADLKHSNFLHQTTGIVDDDACRAQMELLLNRGVDINDRAENLDNTEPGTLEHQRSMLRMAQAGTALHWAVRGWKLGRRNVDVLPRVKWLLQNGADTEIKDDDGLRPIDYATSKPIRDILGVYSLGDN